MTRAPGVRKPVMWSKKSAQKPTGAHRNGVR
jgi:hypothetical protein